MSTLWEGADESCEHQKRCIWLTSERIPHLRFACLARWTRKDFRRDGLGKRLRRFALLRTGRARTRTGSGKRRCGCCGMRSYCFCDLKHGTGALLFLKMRNPPGDGTGFGIATSAKFFFSRPALLGARIKKLKWRQMDFGLILRLLREKNATCKAACGDA